MSVVGSWLFFCLLHTVSDAWCCVIKYYQKAVMEKGRKDLSSNESQWELLVAFKCYLLFSVCLLGVLKF